MGVGVDVAGGTVTVTSAKCVAVTCGAQAVVKIRRKTNIFFKANTFNFISGPRPSAQERRAAEEGHSLASTCLAITSR